MLPTYRPGKKGQCQWICWRTLHGASPDEAAEAAAEALAAALQGVQGLEALTIRDGHNIITRLQVLQTKCGGC